MDIADKTPTPAQIKELNLLANNNNPNYYLKVFEFTGDRYGLRAYEAAINDGIVGIIANLNWKIKVNQLGREINSELSKEITSSLIAADIQHRNRNWNTPLDRDLIAAYHYNLFTEKFSIAKIAWTNEFWDTWADDANFYGIDEIIEAKTLSRSQLMSYIIANIQALGRLIDEVILEDIASLGEIQALDDLICIIDNFDKLLNNERLLTLLTRNFREILATIIDFGQSLKNVNATDRESIRNIMENISNSTFYFRSDYIPLNPFRSNAGTSIVMSDGTEKPIKNLETGDEILAFDQLGNSVSKKVTRLFHNNHQKLGIKIK